MFFSKHSYCCSFALLVILFACKKEKEDEENVSRVSGAPVVPATFDFYPVYTAALKRSGAKWYNCYSGSNDSSDQGVYLTMESKNNCSGTQYLYFYQDQPIDMSDFEDGNIEFKVEVKTASMTLQALIQDDATTVSNTLDLSSYGFTASTTAVAQKIVLPLSALKTDNFDLTNVSRLLEIKVTCPTTSCLMDISDVKWTLANTGGVSLLGKSSRRPYCDPAPCAKLKSAPIRFYVPSKSSWTAVETTASYSSDSSGKFDLSVDSDLFSEFFDADIPVFIAISPYGGDYTLLANVSQEELTSGDVVTIDVDLTTTIASRMQCPGGVYPPKSGNYCYEEPDDSAEEKKLLAAIDDFFEDNPPQSSDLEDLVAAALANEDVLAALTKTAKKHKAEPDVDNIIALDEAAAPPVTYDELSSPSASFPSNLEQGDYLVTITTCVNGSCSKATTTTMTNNGATEFKAAIDTSMRSAIGSCSESGVTCTMSYNSLSKTAFRATFTATACSDDVCATSSVIYDFRKQ